MSNMRRFSGTIDVDKYDELTARGYRIRDLVDIAVDTIYNSDGIFSDYEMEMKVRLIEEDLFNAKKEWKMHDARMLFLDIAIDSLEKSLVDAREDLVYSQTTRVLSKRINELNRHAVIESYDIDSIKSKYDTLIRGILEFNPKFDVDEHVYRLKRIMGA